MRAKGRKRRLLGAALITIGAAVVALPFVLPAYAAWRQAQLASARPAWRAARDTARAGGASALASPAAPAGAAVAVPAQPQVGQVAAFLRVPKIDLAATVLQGTADALLASAPGHEPQSVMPGSVGTSVIVAHNLTFFRHIDLLRPGDRIVAGTAQGVFTFEVSHSLRVAADSPLPNTPWPSIALVACYPLNALYYTPQRFVVEAKLVSASPAPAESLASLRPSPPQFLATLPSDLAQVPLWLSDTHLEVGQATFSGGPSLKLSASGASWSLVAQSIRMFAASLAALARPGASPLAGFGPGPALVGFAGPGPWRVEPEAPLDIAVQLNPSGVPVAVSVSTAAARVRGDGVARVAPYRVDLAVNGATLQLTRVYSP